jgi:hypothetical protein
VRIFPGTELHCSTLFAGCRHGRTVLRPAWIHQSPSERNYQ